MPSIRSIGRWLLRGEANVGETLERLSVDLRAAQTDIDALRASVASLEARLVEVEERSAADAWIVPPVRSDAGVNVIGYLQRQLGIGEIGRRLLDVLAAGDVPASPVDFGATASPPTDRPASLSQRLDHRTSVAVVAADQLATLRRFHPEAVAASDRLIGYCFWELDTLSAPTAAGARIADEIWTASRFVHDAFATLGDVTVRHVPIPVAEPIASDRQRASFAPLAEVGDRPLFGVTFDHFSVAERKNPFGAIAAFREAFPPDAGPVLLVKTLNAGLVPDQHERLLAAAEDRPDVIVWDAHLDRADQLALIRSFDVLVSLHRSEGLGLHLAEAMWLGVPVLATGYSGNLDFMDDDCSALVGYTLVPVTGGQHYPDGARWADPDLVDAAERMRQLASDDGARARLGAAGRERMRAQASDAETAGTIADLLGLAPTGGAGRSGGAGLTPEDTAQDAHR